MAEPQQPVPNVIGPVLAAQILQLDRSTVRRLANKGAIPVHAWTPGGHARFLKSDVETLRDQLAARTKLPQSLKRLRQIRQAGS